MHRKIRESLNRGESLVGIGAWDGMSAKLVEAAGYDFVALQSHQISSSMGIPDVGLLTPSELLTIVSRAAGEVNIPIVVDFEQGFGDEVSHIQGDACRFGPAAYWYRRFQKVGVAALHIDDFGHGVKCAFLEHVYSELLPVDLVCQRIQDMVAVRDGSEGPLIIARTGANVIPRFEDGDEELRRLEAYKKAGADIVHPWPIQGPAQLQRVKDELDSPIFFQYFPRLNQVLEDKWPGYGEYLKMSFQEIHDLGADMINFPEIHRLAYRNLYSLLRSVMEEQNLGYLKTDWPSWEMWTELEGYVKHRTGVCDWDLMAEANN